MNGFLHPGHNQIQHIELEIETISLPGWPQHLYGKEENGSTTAPDAKLGIPSNTPGQSCIY